MHIHLHTLFPLFIALVMGWQLCSPLIQFASSTDDVELVEISWEEEEKDADTSDKEESTEEDAKTASDIAYMDVLQQRLFDRLIVLTHPCLLTCKYKGSPQSPPPEV